MSKTIEARKIVLRVCTICLRGKEDTQAMKDPFTGLPKEMCNRCLALRDWDFETPGFVLNEKN